MRENANIQNKTSMNTQEIVCCGMFVALMAVGAKINIVLPLGTGVTVSLQILFVVLAGLLLGPRDGFISVLVYLLLGLFGLPIYAHGGGPYYVLKPTYGFLIGFASAALVTGLLLNMFKKKTRVTYFIAAELGMLTYYVWGLLYFYIMTNFLIADTAPIRLKELMTVWFFSTVWIDALITLLAASLGYRLSSVFSYLTSNKR